MGLISHLFGLLFGEGRNVVVQTAEVFRENAEAGATRASEAQAQALAQFGLEFRAAQRSRFDRLMDAVNRLPRPALALGTLGLFLAAMVDPVWFAARMQGLALVPEPLWWLLGVIVSFYFGARHQAKSQDFQRDLAATMSRAPQVMANLGALADLRADTPGAADTGKDADLTLGAAQSEGNPALDHWKQLRGPATL